MFLSVSATVAVVKSRDMHWGLLAQKDHKDVNLSSLRMLLVADGANPCNLISSIFFVRKCVACAMDEYNNVLIVAVFEDVGHVSWKLTPQSVSRPVT
jgi:hypothetical protein